MAESFSPTGIDLPSPILPARLRELADFLAAPMAGRLTEEQRALALGVARRLVVDVAAEFGAAIDGVALWRDWLAGGLPGAERFSAACFTRAEEHRWREQSAQRMSGSAAPVEKDDADADTPVIAGDAMSNVDRAYLALQIADRRRFDGYGHPRLALADVDADLLRALLLDIAAWRLARADTDGPLGAELGETVRIVMERHADVAGIDRAAMTYHDLLVKKSRLADAAATAIARHDWPTLIALAAASIRRSFADTTLALLTAEAAALPILLAPLRLDPAALAPMEASLAMLSARAVAAGGGPGDE